MDPDTYENFALRILHGSMYCHVSWLPWLPLIQ